MAGKAPVFPSWRLARAMDALSKNTLIDLAVDLARKDVGEDATDDRIALWLEEQLGPVHRVRGDKPVSLIGLMAKLDGNDVDYALCRGKHARVKEYEPAAAELRERVRSLLIGRMPACLGGVDQHATATDFAWLAQHEIDLYREGEETDIKGDRDLDEVRKFLAFCRGLQKEGA